MKINWARVAGYYQRQPLQSEIRDMISASGYILDRRDLAIAQSHRRDLAIARLIAEIDDLLEYTWDAVMRGHGDQYIFTLNSKATNLIDKFKKRKIK